MKRMMTNALAIAAAASWVMVAGAQSSTSATQSERSSKNDGKAMKFTGCLQQGDTPNSYKLTNVQPADTSSSGSSTSGTSGSGSTGSGTTGSGTTGSGTTGSGSSEMGSMTVNELTLVPSGSKVDLSAHVGKRVEITTKAMKDSDRSTSGTSGSEMGSGSTGSGTTGSGQSGMHSEHGMGKKVQVTAVRELSGSCSGQ